MRAWCVAVMVVGASTAWAGKKTVIISAGDCADPSLVSGAKDFRDAAARLLGPQLMESEVVLDIVRPRATRSLQDLERQIDSAKALFYGGQADRAEGLIDRALEELDRASPESKPWPATQSALVLKALIAKSLDRPKDMTDAFRRIVRIDPGFKLDPDAHAPSAIASLEAVKKELSRARRSSILVRVDTGTSATPPVATVFVDGQPLGTTPLKLDLPPGTYRVALTSGSMVSFPHRIELPRDSKLGVDLAFEGTVGTQAPLCLSDTGHTGDASAVKLAQLVAAENVIILRNTARRAEPPYLAGTVYELASGQQERSGSVQPELLSNLATFLVTGKEMTGVAKPGGEPVPVVTLTPVPLEKKVELQPRALPQPVVTRDAPVATKVAEPAVRPVTFDVSGDSSGGRVLSFTLIGVGAGVAIGGVIAFVAGAADRTRLAGIAPAGHLPSQTTTAGRESLELMQRIDTNNAVSLGLMGAGGGAVVAGIIGAVLFPSSETKVSLTPTPEGVSAAVQGRF